MACQHTERFDFEKSQEQDGAMLEAGDFGFDAYSLGSDLWVFVTSKLGRKDLGT